MSTNFRDWPVQMPTSEDYENKPAGHYKHQYNVVDDKVVEIKNVIVHRFRVGDVEDPELYAAEPLWNWQQSEMGKWVMEHAVETPTWHHQLQPMHYHHEFVITAKLSGKDLTYFYLKWKDDIDKMLK